MSDLELYPPVLHPEDLESGVSHSGSAIQPGSEVEGPPLSPLEIELRNVSRFLGRLNDQLAHVALRASPRWETQQARTDSNGDLSQKIFSCPATHRARISRVVFEAAGYTPAVPYSNAAAFILLTRGRPAADANQLGGLIDFAPATAGGAILPGLFESLSCRSSYLLYPGEDLYARIESGPASTNVAISALIDLEPVSITALVSENGNG